MQKDCPCQLKVESVSSENYIHIQINPGQNEVHIGTIDPDIYNTPENLSEIILRKGYSPFINEDTGTWFEYDDELKGFVDTHVLADYGRHIPITLDEVNFYWAAAVREEV